MAASIKHHAHSHPLLRKFSMMLGRNYEVFVGNVEYLWEHKRVNPNPKLVADSIAFTVGADLISQGFLISTALSLVLFEYWRGSVQKEAESAERAARKSAKNALREARLLDMERNIADLHTRVIVNELELEDLAGRLR